MKTIEQLMELKRHVESGLDRPLLRTTVFQGQSWGGAEAMVISDDAATIASFSHSSAEKLCTQHAADIGRFYKSIMRSLSDDSNYNYFNKYEFWGRITVAGKEAVQENLDVSAQELKLVLIDQAIKVISEWSNTEGV